MFYIVLCYNDHSESCWGTWDDVFMSQQFLEKMLDWVYHTGLGKCPGHWGFWTSQDISSICWWYLVMKKTQQLGVQVGQLPTPVTVRLCFPDFPDPRQIRPNPWWPVSGCWSEPSFRQPNQVANTETYTFRTFQEQSFAETRRIQMVPHIHFSVDEISVVKVCCHHYQFSPL